MATFATLCYLRQRNRVLMLRRARGLFGEGRWNAPGGKLHSPSTWRDFVRLFAKHGGVWGGCWCMFYQTTTGWSKRTGAQNRQRKKRLVDERRAHGILVYENKKPVGWCQFGPKGELPRIDRMRNYKINDLAALWRITCFFVDKDYRGRGVANVALAAALKAIKRRGGRLVEAYPIQHQKGRKLPSSFLWYGSLSLFRRFGFVKTSRLGKQHYVVRRTL